MTTIVIPVRPSEHNPELPYALRSIHAHVPNPDIWIIGHQPRWLTNVHHIPTRPTGRKPDRGCQQARTAATHPDIPDAFWWWDDDMYRLAPLHGPDTRHGGPLTDWLDCQYRNVESNYCQVLRRTATLLPPGALMYDLHIPYWIPDKAALADTLQQLPDGHGGWLWRTFHGNRHHLRGYESPDVKVYRRDPIPDPPGPWLSSDNASFQRILTAVLQPRYPDPSPWEPPPPVPVTYRRGTDTRCLTPTPSQHQHMLDNGWQPVPA